MPLTPAERAKRSREKKKATEESKIAYLEKESKRKRESYVGLPINERSSRQQRITRKRWRNDQRSSRLTQKLQKAADKHLVTPPTSPNEQVEFQFPPQGAWNSAQNRGRRKVRRDRSQAHRNLNKLKVKLCKTETKLNRYKKRFQRLNKRFTEYRCSPKSKTNIMLKTLKGGETKGIRKCLLFHNSLLGEIQARYTSSKDRREKAYLSRIVCGKIMKKYRVQRRAKEALQCFGKGLLNRKVRSDVLSNEIVNSVVEFYCRDDNSKMLPGKKDTITRLKLKAQKRLLGDTMKHLHQKYLFENPTSMISYTKFTSLRPFYVVVPTLSDRETCLCKRHSNIQLMVEKLYSEKVISKIDFIEQIKLMVCDLNNKECMYGKCSECKDKWLPHMPKDLRDKSVEFFQWITKKEQRTKVMVGGKEEKFDVNISVKDKVTSTLWDLHEKFQNEIKTRFAQHIFNINHQYKVLRELRQNLQDDEVIIHIDFSENYSCKYSEEIQSVHFGASRSQVTLHTGVCYRGKLPVISFCTVSSSPRHDPSAIWAHIQPVLLKYAPPDTTSTLHFISDGPTTQYRNKLHFYLSATIPFELKYQLVTWNFLEAGHGKGAADGIGGTLKRSADRLVANGKDIKNSDDFITLLKPESVIDLLMVKESDIAVVDTRFTNRLKTVI